MVKMCAATLFVASVFALLGMPLMCTNTTVPNNKSPFERIYDGGNPIVNMKHLVDASGNISVTGGPHTIPRFGGRLNNLNTNDATELVDVFFPTNAHRVGDDGHGRGLRYPTAFNEDVLTALDEPYHATGVVLSHHTAEPNMNDGYIRARNDVLQPDEVPRGIAHALILQKMVCLRARSRSQ